MRQIIMSKPGEFSKQTKTDYFRSAAVKMMAAVIKKPDEKEDSNVIVSNKALQRTTR